MSGFVHPLFRIVLFALPAAGLLAGCGGQSPGSVLAEVGPRRITVQDFEDSYLRLKPEDRPVLDTEEAKRSFLQDLINKDIMELAAFEKYPELPEQQGWRLTRYRWNQLDTILGKYLIDRQIRVTEAEKDEAYENRKRDILLDVIVLPTKEMGETLLERLRAGTPFEKLALEYSIEESADPEHPGRVGWVAWGTYSWELEREIWKAKPGEVVGPIEDLKRRAWFIARPVESRPVPSEGTREELDPILDVQIREPRYLSRQKAILDSLREAAGVSYPLPGDALMMKKFYWEPPEHLRDDPMAFLNDQRLVPTLEAHEETVVVVDFATIPDWTAKEFLEHIAWYPTGIWPRGHSEEQLHEVYDMVVRDFLNRKAAADYGYDKLPEFVEAVDRKAREMRVTLLYNRDVVGAVELTQEEIQAWFEQNRERYKAPPSFKVASFATKERAVAEQIRDAWRGGTRFGELRDRFTAMDANLDAIGESAWLAVGADPPIDELIAELKEGDVSDIFTRGDVHVVLQLVGRRDARLVPYEEVKSYVDEDAKNSTREERLKAFLKEQEAKYGVKVREKELGRLKTPVAEGAPGA